MVYVEEYWVDVAIMAHRGMRRIIASDNGTRVVFNVMGYLDIAGGDLNC